MLAVPYSRVLNQAVELYTGVSPASAPDAAVLNRRIRHRATEFWEMFFWPEWTTIEQRQFRNTYSQTTNYNPGDQVYFPQTLAYYQCLAACANIPPVNTTICQINYANWCLAQGEYCGLSCYDPTVAYTPGCQITWPNTQLQYQCLQTTTAGTDPSNATYWGLLVPFLRNITFTQSWQTSVIAQVRRVLDLNPLIHNNACQVPFIITNQGIVCRGRVPVVWTEFRLPAPNWEGPVWSATATYIAGQQVYYNNGLSADYYVATGSVAAGSSPTGGGAWAIIPFPYVFRDCVAQAAYADMLKIDGQQDKAAAEVAEASRLLNREFDKIERQQGQTRPLQVVNSFNANQAW